MPRRAYPGKPGDPGYWYELGSAPPGHHLPSGSSLQASTRGLLSLTPSCQQVAPDRRGLLAFRSLRTRFWGAVSRLALTN